MKIYELNAYGCSFKNEIDAKEAKTKKTEKWLVVGGKNGFSKIYLVVDENKKENAKNAIIEYGITVHSIRNATNLKKYN